MKIKFLSGPRQGEEKHTTYSQETQLLADAGIIEILSSPQRGTNEYLAERAAISASFAPPTVSPKVSWSVRAAADGDTQKRPAVYGVCSNANCAVRFRYEGTPERADSVVFLHSCGSHAPTKVPATIVDLYRATCENRPLTEYTADEAAVLGYAARKGEDSGRREVDHGKGLLNKDGSIYKLFFEK